MTIKRSCLWTRKWFPSLYPAITELRDAGAQFWHFLIGKAELELNGNDVIDHATVYMSRIVSGCTEEETVCHNPWLG